ncbi:mannan-binding lectin serine protease 2 [Pseudophryne corroboree]|uniref:mannan-binding lectin serine protease 2 n=1 Tax=Pseudophryne corroboree TaxID=495146 RepID=UPI0030817B30
MFEGFCPIPRKTSIEGHSLSGHSLSWDCGIVTQSKGVSRANGNPEPSHSTENTGGRHGTVTMRLWHLLYITTFISSNGYCIELTGLYGRISSPGYPKPYPNDQTLTWDIRVPEGHRIKIYFTHFHLELSYLCEYDYVKLTSQGTVVAHVCGKDGTDIEEAPGDAPFYSRGNKMTVTFRSDYSNEKEFSGFEAFYMAEDINECDSQTEDTEICDHFCHNHIGGYYCSCRTGFRLHTDRKTCIVKCDDVTYTASSSEITSPDFPGVYPKLTNCKYRIQAEEGFSILLTFLHFDVESHPDTVCPYDRLQITAKGKNLPPLCGDNLPPEMDTGSNKVDILFTADGSGHHTGWKIQYTTKALPCPDPLLPPRGHFMPPKKVYVVKDRLSLFCDIGHVLLENKKIISSFTAVCQTDGTWDKPLPTCVIVDCGVPDNIDNGTLTFAAARGVTTYGAIIQYKCTGSFYNMRDGQGKYQCGEEGYWEDINTKSKTLPACVPDCGKRKPGPVQRIIGGKITRLGAFPWQVFIKGADGGTGGGALLNDRWIITAAHVIYKKALDDMNIKMGLIKSDDTNFIRAFPEAVFIHEDYKDDETYNNDIALIKLRDKVPVSENILGICLPTKEPRYHISHNEDSHHTGQVSGWGYTEREHLSRNLRFVEVNIMDHEKCAATYRAKSTAEVKYTVTENMICAGHQEGGKDSCAGDSGGPLVFFDTETQKWFIGGIVSWGLGCGVIGQYGVYTKVSNYLDWIENTIQKP